MSCLLLSCDLLLDDETLKKTEAQRLIFQYTEKGDLTKFLSAYFDPKSAQARGETDRFMGVAATLGIAKGDHFWCLIYSGLDSLTRSLLDQERREFDKDADAL